MYIPVLNFLSKMINKYILPIIAQNIFLLCFVPFHFIVTIYLFTLQIIQQHYSVYYPLMQPSKSSRLSRLIVLLADFKT